jgi:hypothetical protein
MVVASGDNVAAILGVGANDSILIADTSASVGVKWGNSISNLTITNITGTAGTITTFGSTKGTITNLGGTNLNYTGIGTIANISNTNINSSGIHTASIFNSTVATGTAPLTVASTTLVSNLNSQYLNGNASTYYLAASGGTATNLILSGTLTAGGGNGSSGQVLQSTGSGLQWGSSAEFASSTTIIFYQASAPTGWTKSTSHDNKALRVVSGTGGGSGGSSSFTSVFASRGVPLPEHNHSASSGNHDGHQHSGPTSSQSINHDHPFTTGFPNTNHTHTITTGNQSANHTHTFTTGNQNADHSHAYTTNAVGDHNHLINGYITSNEAGGYGLTFSGGFENRVLVTAPNGQGTTYAGAHSHDGGTGGQSANHQHGGTTAGMSVDHNHSGTTSGVSESHYHGGTTGGGGGSHSHDFTTQSGGSHNHSISISNNGTASASMDFAVQYIDVIICSKN